MFIVVLNIDLVVYKTTTLKQAVICISFSFIVVVLTLVKIRTASFINTAECGLNKKSYWGP